MRIHTRTATFVAFILSAVLLVACGGGGGGGGGAANGTSATVGVLITDAPAGKWDQAIATITSVTLIGGNGQVTLFSGSQTLDLLQLGDFSELFAVSDNVPPGQYSKIRLRLSDLVLNDLDATGAVVESVHPQLVGNGKLDLNPREPFTLAPGDVVFVELDFDMEKALKITETGNGKIIVRPVVFVNIRSGQPPEVEARLSRIHGVINEVDATAGTVLLCQSVYVSQFDNQPSQLPDFGPGHCVTLQTDGATGIFGPDGLPEDITGLVVGEEATAIGKLMRLDPPDSEHPFAMHAVVIEEGPLGTFRRVAGIAASGVDAATDRFNLNVAPGQDIATTAPLPVQLYEHSRIFTRLGEELTRADITAGRGVLADGVLPVATEDVLRSPFLILGPLLPLEAVLRGDLASVDAGTGRLIVATDTGDRCVDAAVADVFLVSQVDGLSFTRGALADLQPGQRLAVFGSEGTDGCLTAGTVIAEQ